MTQLLDVMKENNRLLRKQNRKAQGYERLAELIANALDRVISPTPFATDPFISNNSASAASTDLSYYLD